MKNFFFRKITFLTVLSLCTMFIIGCEDNAQPKDETKTGDYTACVTYYTSKSTMVNPTDEEIEPMQAMVSLLTQITKSENFVEEVKTELEKHEITDYDEDVLKDIVTVEAIGGTTAYNVLVTLDNSEIALIIADFAGEYLKEYFCDKVSYAVIISKIEGAYLK